MQNFRFSSDFRIFGTWIIRPTSHIDRFSSRISCGKGFLVGFFLGYIIENFFFLLLLLILYSNSVVLISNHLFLSFFFNFLLQFQRYHRCFDSPSGFLMGIDLKTSYCWLLSQDFISVLTSGLPFAVLDAPGFLSRLRLT